MSDAVHEYFAGLPPERLDEIARAFLHDVEAAGLTVYRADEARFIPIPPVLTPEVVTGPQMDALCADARRLLSATIKLARWTYGPAGRAVADRLYGAFTPLEHEALARDPARLGDVATARVDYFIDATGRAQALELNATIPAMQGYSDIIAHTWIRTVARERGLPRRVAEDLVATCGSNTGDLLSSLVAHYRRRGGEAEHPSILIVSRRHDAQQGELRHYERTFTDAGHRALHVWADEVELDRDGRMRARGERFDLLYRHIFARRVDAASPLARLLVDPGRNILFNPVASPLEVKGMLAFLHATIEDDARAGELALDAKERETIARIVPWTRLLDAENAAWVTAHRDELVLKKSWDYGGKSVVLGPDHPDWADVVARAVQDPEAWVVQAYVPPRPVRHLLALPTGAAWRDLYVDVSAYANHAVGPSPRGGACRASGAKIVNILGGGGLTPLVPAPVVDALFARG